MSNDDKKKRAEARRKQIIEEIWKSKDKTQKVVFGKLASSGRSQNKNLFLVIGCRLSAYPKCASMFVIISRSEKAFTWRTILLAFLVTGGAEKYSVV